MIRAVLFDVGGPLDTEEASEAAIDAEIRAGLEACGYAVDEAAWVRANAHAIETFAPSLYRAMVWELTGGDLRACTAIAERLDATDARRDLFALRPGIPDALAALKQRGLRLGLAANQPREVLARLKAAGIGHYFGNQGVSGVYGYRKPDVRLFLRACGDLGVTPEECIMVGDRIDDIVPAKLLGMRTVLIRTGRHIAQQPRSWDELPDCEVRDAPGILAAIEDLLTA